MFRHQQELEVENCRNEIERLKKEYGKLVAEIEVKAAQYVQSDDTLSDKINRLVIEREDLFDGIGDDTNERLEHIISLIENQATQIGILEAERDQLDKQLQRYFTNMIYHNIHKSAFLHL